MRDWRTWAGVGIGAALSVVLFAVVSRLGAPRTFASGPFVPDFGGSIEELVVHFAREGGETVGPTYRSFLAQLPRGVTVHVVCPEEADARAFASLVGDVPCRVAPVVAGHPVTCWSRDRWVALAPAGGAEEVTLWLPREEALASRWPARAGDQVAGETLARTLPGRVRAVRSGFLFDGGDFVADERTVFVAQTVAARNLQHTVETRGALERTLADRFHRRVVLLHDVPEHHAGMYMMLAGDDVALVGDPSLARRFVDGESAPLCPCGDDFSTATQRLFDAAALQCAAAGYRVVRVPTVPGTDSRTFVTFVNVILDDRDGRRTVWMPSYENAQALTGEAERIWQGLGYDVRRVDCTRVYLHFGALRCLVSVLRRGPSLRT